MNLRHHYIKKGGGTPFIFLHGNNEDSSYFNEQIEEFSKDYKVIALDTRGHGKTGRGETPFTIRQFAQDLKKFMDRKKIKKAHILGFSDGANIAMCFASKYPEMVGRLILYSGNLNSKGVHPLVQIPVEIGYKIRKLLYKCLPFRCIKKFNKRRGELLGLMVNQPNITLEELNRIKAITLVIAGTYDMIKASHTKFIHKHIKNSKLIFIEGDHFISKKKPKEFNAAVKRFMKGDAKTF